MPPVTEGGLMGQVGGMQRVGGRRAVLGMLVVSALLGSALAGPALAQLPAERVGADYVIAVDTSGSMQESGLYRLVRPAISGALRGAAASDRLALLTFDTRPALRHAGLLGPRPEQAARQLPAAATGANTDIGAVADAILGQLERPGAADVAAVVLLTDGEHDPPAGSRYCAAPACDGAWRALAERARRLPEGRVRVYAIALRPEIVRTVRATLGRVFRDPEVVELPPGQVAAYLDQIKQQVRVAKARRLVRRDAAAAVEARWAGPLTGVDLATGRAEADLTLRSTARELPLAVARVSVAADGFGLRVTGVPDRVELAPGAQRTIRVALTWDPVRRPDFGRPSASRDATLQVRGTVAPNLGAGLDGAGPPGGLPLRGGTAAFAGTAATGWDRPTLLIAGLLLLIAAVTAVVIWVYRNPVMHGVLIVERLAPTPSARSGYARKHVGVLPLSGRRTSLRRPGALDPGTGPGWVRGIRPRRDAGPAVRIAYSGPSARWPRDRRVCRLGQLVVLRGHVFRYLPSDSPALRDTQPAASTPE